MGSKEFYSENMHGTHQYFDLGSFPLTTGYTLPAAKLAYKTHGTLNEAKDNAIIFPHMYSGTSAAMEIFVGEGRPLDPSKYFIIFPGQFGGGFSSSPSNTPPPYHQGMFPPVAIADDVRAQHRLVTEHFGIQTLYAVIGWSMGGQQTYEWAVRYPDQVQRAVVVAATARTLDHNVVFIDLHEELLRSDPAWRNGFYASSDDVHVGLRRHALAFSLMGMSPDFYREEVWREAGFASANDFRQGFVRGYFLPMDPNNLLAQAGKWRASNVGLHTGGDVAAALGTITARTIVAAFQSDMFFPPEDCAADAALIPGAQSRVIASPWGHFTMFCVRPVDQEAIDAVLAEALGD